MDKVKAAAREMESKLGQDMSNSPGFDPAAREIVFRAFRVDNPWFDRRRTVREFEQRMQREGKRIFVERICRGGRLIDEVTPRMAIRSGDGIVLSGRRQYVIEEEEWIGQEIVDDRLTDFSIMTLPVVVNRKGAKGCSVGSVLANPTCTAWASDRSRAPAPQCPFTGTACSTRATASCWSGCRRTCGVPPPRSASPTRR